MIILYRRVIVLEISAKLYQTEIVILHPKNLHYFLLYLSYKI